MTTQNGPQHGATQQPWWDAQAPAQYPNHIPAQRSAGWDTGTPQPPKKPRRWLKWTGGIAAAILLLSLGAAMGGGNGQTTSTTAADDDAARIASLEQQLSDSQRASQDLQAQLDSQTAAPAAPAVPAAPAAPVAPVETGPATSVSDGTYEVGVDLVAGRYKTSGPGSTDILDSCYVERSKDDSGELDSIIANDNLTGPSSVTVMDGEFVTFNGGCTWAKQ